jgi:hypothetical protein
MTIFKGIDITEVNYETNELKCAIKNNEPIEDKLNVILVISNPCEYIRRYVLLNEFVKRIEEEEEDVILYIVELVYGEQKFMVTNSENKNHLQLRTETPLWHKENMINIAVNKLLPNDFKAFAWIDADIEFESVTWAKDTLKILNGYKDVVQLYSHCIDMNKDGNTLNVFNSLGYSFSKKKQYTSKGLDYWHPGFAWAMTRKMYNKIGKIYDKGILGSGDNVMAFSFLNICDKFTNAKYSKDYNNSMLDFQVKTKNVRLGYVPGVIRHHYHGSKKNRKYIERTEILSKYQFSPKIDIKYDENGIIIPTNYFHSEFKKDIMKYFQERKEDN